MLTILGIASATLFLVHHWKRRSGRRFRAWVGLIGGACFVGGSGWMAQAITQATGWGQKVSQMATANATGTTVGWVVALTVVLLWFYDMGLDDRINKLRGKGGGAGGGGGLAGRLSGGSTGAVSGLTPWLSWLVAASVLALSGLPTQLADGAPALVQRYSGG